MKNGLLFLVILIMIATVFLYNTANSENDKKVDEVGTYALFKINDGSKEVLYRINTKTGQVWCYSEYAILSSKDIGVTGKEKESLDNLIEQTNKQGKNVYTLPYWMLTSEEKLKYYTVH